MLLPNLIQVTESISGSVVPLAMFLSFCLDITLIDKCLNGLNSYLANFCNARKIFPNSHHSLETGVELYEERGLESHCQHPLLHHRALNVVVLVIIVVIVTTVLLITNMIEIFEKIKGGLKSIACLVLSDGKNTTSDNV